MMEVLARNWGLVALRAVAALIFGVLMLVLPAISLAVLILLFGVYAFADGAFTAIAAVANRRGQPGWVSLLIAGLVGIAIGIATLFWPGVTAMALVLIIAAWAIVHGIGEIVAAIRLRHVMTGEWRLLLAGILSVVFGVLIALFPGAGALALVVWIGIGAIVLGIVRLVLAFRLRSWARENLPAEA